MNTSIFRKVSLERLSSPEQLDEAYRVTTPMEWLGLIAVIVLLAAAVIWSIEGSISTKVSAPGVIMRRGGVMNVVASGSGLVLELSVAPSEHVRANQVIAKIAQPVLADRIKVTEAALADARLERERTLAVRGSAATLQIDALNRERANHEREIQEVRAQAKVVAEQIPVDEELLAKGLITKQQTLVSKERLVTLEGQIATLEALIKQIDAQKFNIQTQPVDTDAAMKARVAELERSVASLHEELSTSANVVSPYSGQVLELKVYRGSPVSEGAPIISIQPDVDALEVLVYLASARAKDVTPGMEAEISPGTVRREEYGFLRGKVAFVAAYPATPASMMRNLENEVLTQSLASGPVTELRINLEPATTPSGFRWSSRDGPPLTLSSGTLCSTMIVTRKQRPITLALPAVRKMLGAS